MRKTGEDRACEVCGKMFYVKRVQLASTRFKGGRFCSVACKAESQRGVEWAPGGRFIRKDGYVSVKTGIRSYELEHRLVAQAILGRTLATEEHVHHLNGDKADNRPENLRVMSNEDHQREHEWNITQSRRVTLTCKRCGQSYQRKPSRVAESNYCSAPCRLEVQHDAARAYWARRREEREKCQL